MYKTVYSAAQKFFAGIPFVRFTKTKALLGLVLGAAALYICMFRYGCFREAVLFGFAFFFLGLFRLDFTGKPDAAKNRIISAVRLLWSLICLFTVCIFSLDFIDLSISANLASRELALNLLCSFILYSFFFSITGNCVGAVIIAVLVMMGMSTINGFVFLFRGKEFCAMDIFSVGTAANVASQYTYNFPPHIAFRWLATILLIFSLFSLPLPAKKRRIIPRLIMLAAVFLSALTLFMSSRDIGVKTWEYQGSQFNGFYLNFCLGIRDSISTKPNGYAAESVELLSESYADTFGQADKKPNIIVIMNEAFSDLSVFQNELVLSDEVMPFISALSNDTIKGRALVSVFAGNTANSEFEFLTSHTMAFFPNPSNSVPYQQYINGPIYCFPQLMNALGYESFATHPFHADGWSRNVQYPRFGFASATFLDSYPKENTIRSFVCDQEMYEYVIDVLSSNAENTPLFLFGVTMQNHSAYNSPDFKSTIEISSPSGNFPLTEQYLSLIRESDKAVEYLLGELEDYPEDTVVLFFGDHMPMIEDELYTVLNGGTPDSLDERMLKYTVPFFIWANYDIEEYTLEKTSLNYLAGHLLEAAGIELPPYYQFLRDTEEIIPAINAFGYYSESRGCMIPLEEAEGEEAEALQRYEHVQYNNMFDAENRNQLFFGQYIN